MLALKSRLRSFIVDNYMFGQDTDIRDNESFLELGIIDSTGILELVSYLERDYGLNIEPEEIIPENLDSLEKLTAFLLRKQSAVRVVGSIAENKGSEYETDV